MNTILEQTTLPSRWSDKHDLKQWKRDGLLVNALDSGSSSQGAQERRVLSEKRPSLLNCIISVLVRNIDACDVIRIFCRRHLIEGGAFKIYLRKTYFYSETKASEAILSQIVFPFVTHIKYKLIYRNGYQRSLRFDLKCRYA